MLIFLSFSIVRHLRRHKNAAKHPEIALSATTKIQSCDWSGIQAVGVGLETTPQATGFMANLQAH
jgi:hypothetical protein